MPFHHWVKKRPNIGRIDMLIYLMLGNLRRNLTGCQYLLDLAYLLRSTHPSQQPQPFNEIFVTEIFSRRNGTRTHMRLAPRFLRPGCIPFHHPPLFEPYKRTSGSPSLRIGSLLGRCKLSLRLAIRRWDSWPPILATIVAFMPDIANLRRVPRDTFLT